MLSIKYVVVPKGQELVFISNKLGAEKITAIATNIYTITTFSEKHFNNNETDPEAKLDSVLNTALVKCLHEAVYGMGVTNIKAVVGHNYPEFYASTKFSITVVTDDYEPYLQEPVNLVRAG